MTPHRSRVGIVRVEDIDDSTLLLIEPFKVGAKNGGLAGSHLTRDDDEPLPLVYTVNDRGQCLLMRRTEIQELGIGCHVERVFLEMIKAGIHGVPPLFLSSKQEPNLP